MIVYGENDRNAIGLRNSAILGLMPVSQIVFIPNASHAAYLSDKHLWHKLLFNFLKSISENINV
jgi:pimeloyl-ACP methyl ester carboxylesterase